MRRSWFSDAFITDNKNKLHMSIWIIFLVSLLAQVLAVYHFMAPSRSIFNLMFGFGPYVRNLMAHGNLEDCALAVCAKSTRMPVVPLVVSFLGKISGTHSARLVAIEKAFVFGALFIFAFDYLLRSFFSRISTTLSIWCVIAVFLFLSPVTIKHMAAIDYEEGFIILPLIIWTMSSLLLVYLLLENSVHRETRRVSTIFILSATLVFFTKSSMLVVLILSVSFSIYIAFKYKDKAMASVILVCISLIALWGVRNYVSSGNFSIMTSWGGANLFRGWSSEGLELYPEVNLDQLMQGPAIAHLSSGKTITISKRPGINQFQNEWAWNDYYKNMAVTWGLNHKLDAAYFTYKKLYNLFVGIEKTPYTYSLDARKRAESPVVIDITDTWLFMGRLFELVYLFLCYRLWSKGGRRGKWLVVVSGAAILAYCVPYVIGFNYERHVSVFLVVLITATAVLTSEWRQNIKDASPTTKASGLTGNG